MLLQNLENGVLTLTLNRPEALNALTNELLERLAAALDEAQGEAVRCVVLTGAGRAFCAGQDLKSIYPNGAADIAGFSFKAHLEHYSPVLACLAELNKPVVAGVNGVAAGAGLSLALACDLRLASAGASFVTAFGKIGLVPDSGMSWTLPRLVGYAKALELALLSPKLGAEEALALGLVTRVVPEASFEEELQTLATALAQGPTKAYGLMKRALREGATSSFEGALAFEAEAQDAAGRSTDHAEGVEAFLAKRPARFRGR